MASVKEIESKIIELEEQHKAELVLRSQHERKARETRKQIEALQIELIAAYRNNSGSKSAK